MTKTKVDKLKQRWDAEYEASGNVKKTVAIVWLCLTGTVFILSMVFVVGALGFAGGMNGTITDGDSAIKGTKKGIAVALGIFGVWLLMGLIGFGIFKVIKKIKGVKHEKVND